MKILVSSCLIGERVRYDGGSKPVAWIQDLAKDHEIHSFCPEVTGGLTVPREPAEIQGSSLSILNGESQGVSVTTSSGNDVTKEFLKGAKATLDYMKKHEIQLALLKERSPSCGKSQVYDGSHTGKVIPGQGISAELLNQAGITVFSEEEELQFLIYLIDAEES